MSNRNQGVPKRYSGVADFLNKAVREAGPWGLFRGLSPTITMIAPQIGIGFAVYELVKANPPTWLEGAPPSRGQSLAIAEPMVDRAEEVTGSDSEGARSGVDRIDVDVRHGREVRAEKGKADHAGRSRLEAMWPMVAGGVSGMTSKLAVFPLDTLKKRVQAQVCFCVEILDLSKLCNVDLTHCTCYSDRSCLRENNECM